ncbi:hemicentin-1 isoform X2 [Oryzias melastigma]|nr:hemicentin-1 isoform X2 [Oryzias melastigma]XP_036071835.1 hemicentin-1 isoform X2 [Oryzias melastigma]
MAGIQTIFTLLVICLMKGFLCIQTKREFNIIIPETVEVLTGSCLTIPCSFDIRKEYDGKLNRNCKGTWVAPGTKTTKLPPVDKIGNLTEKNCTSTFLNMNSDHAGESQFRLDCDNELKWTFTNLTLTVKLIDRPPSPTLSPSALTVKEGTSVSLTCSAPASCLSHPPTLTWTPKLADSQETLKENQDQTKVQISVLNFTASHLHHGKRITCTAVYWKHGGSGVSVNSSLTANIRYSPKDTRVSVSPSGPVPVHRSVSLTCISDARPKVKNYSWYRDDGEQESLIGHGRVLNITTSISYRDYFCKAENELGPGSSNITHINVLFPPWIRPLSKCTKAGNQINCSCETDGNPAPNLIWLLNGKTVNQSETTKINTDSLNKTYLRSSIILSLSQINDCTTLICSSSNYLGSTKHQFSLNDLKIQDEVSLLLILRVTVVSLISVFVLLIVIRFLYKRHKLKNQMISEINTNPHPLVDRNEEAAEDKLDFNTSEL